MAVDPLKDKLTPIIRNFFLNNPLQDIKKLSWELYTCWVYQDEVGDRKEHYDRLFFYERLIEFMEELSEMTSIDKQ